MQNKQITLIKKHATVAQISNQAPPIKHHQLAKIDLISAKR